MRTTVLARACVHIRKVIMRSIAGLPVAAGTLRRAEGDVLCSAKTYTTVCFSLRQRWDSWHFALQMQRRAMRPEPTRSWLTLRYTSKLAHSAITLAWLATNPISTWRRGCSLQSKDLRRRSFFCCVSGGI